MGLHEEVVDFIRNGEKYYLTGLSIECVIFGYHDQELKVLLGRHPEGWAFPGAYIKKGEKLDDAAARILKERTSLENIFLQQFHAFGDSEFRLNNWVHKYIPPELIKEFDEDNWLLRRTVAIGYYALIDYSLAEVNPVYPFEALAWYNINEIPLLLFDHQEILDKALEALRTQVHIQPIGPNLLPEKFTLPEIHVLFETILNKKLDRRNFPKKLTALGILEKLDEKRKIGQHRSPYLYKFNIEKYKEVIKEGFALAF